MHSIRSIVLGGFLALSALAGSSASAACGVHCVVVGGESGVAFCCSSGSCGGYCEVVIF